MATETCGSWLRRSPDPSPIPVQITHPSPLAIWRYASRIPCPARTGCKEWCRVCLAAGRRDRGPRSISPRSTSLAAPRPPRRRSCREKIAFRRQRWRLGHGDRASMRRERWPLSSPCAATSPRPGRRKSRRRAARQPIAPQAESKTGPPGRISRIVPAPPGRCSPPPATTGQIPSGYARREGAGGAQSMSTQISPPASALLGDRQDTAPRRGTGMKRSACVTRPVIHLDVATSSSAFDLRRARSRRAASLPATIRDAPRPPRLGPAAVSLTPRQTGRAERPADRRWQPGAKEWAAGSASIDRPSRPSDLCRARKSPKESRPRNSGRGVETPRQDPALRAQTHVHEPCAWPHVRRSLSRSSDTRRCLRGSKRVLDAWLEVGT